ncbi:MAG: Gfo/Idh/MocA family oxidoreductase [Armatimonadota bacterium]|nr:MAG: Gfo/Idh/MocA family oxidoreductase [Armatimonadota bacterium]
MAKSTKARKPAGKIRVGFIGCGGIAVGHFKRLLEVPRCEVVALNDTSEDSLKRFVERAPEAAELPTYSDYKQMLDEVELDAVEIATPHTVHFEQAMEALNRGLHVLLEKPMVCRVDDAKQIIQTAKKKKLVVVVSYQRHYDGGYRYVRQAVQKGVLGKVHFVSAMQAQSWYPGYGWRGDPALAGGGQLNDSGSHLIDIILWTTGLVPKEVFAYIDNMGARVDILSAISVEFQGGALANISVVGHAPGWWEDFSIWGDKGALYLRGGKILLQKDGKLQDVTGKAKGTGNADRNFIEAIRGKAEVQSDAVGGLRVIQLTEAAWDSGKLGRAVKVKV